MYKLTIKTIYETIELEIEEDELLTILKLYAGTYNEIEVKRVEGKVKKLGGINESKLL